MAKLQALQSIYFSVNGKTFMCTGTLGTDSRTDCIDILKNLENGQYYHVKRSHTMSQNITWLDAKKFQTA